MLWNGCGCAKADPLMAAGDRGHQGDVNSAGGDASSPNGPCFSPLWHGGSLAPTV